MRVRPVRAATKVVVCMIGVLPGVVQRMASFRPAELRTVGGVPRKTDRGGCVQLPGAAARDHPPRSVAMDARTRAAESIARAQSELDRAMGEIDLIHTLDPSVLGAVAHALDNYITVTAATVEMLQLVLRDHADRDVAIWLKGIGHATDLMLHTVGRLVSLSPPRDFHLTLDSVNLQVLMERAAEYYRRRGTPNNIQIVCRAVGEPPLAWGDRVAMAVVAENLLANAVRVTPAHGVVYVEVKGEDGHVRVTVRDPGPGLTSEEQRQMVGVLEGGGAGASGGGPGLRIAQTLRSAM